MSGPCKRFSRGGWWHQPPLEKSFLGVAHGVGCPRKRLSRGGWCHGPPLEIDFQGRPFYLSLKNLISNCARQGRVARPPLKMPIYLPLETFSAVMCCIYVNPSLYPCKNLRFLCGNGGPYLLRSSRIQMQSLCVVHFALSFSDLLF